MVSNKCKGFVSYITDEVGCSFHSSIFLVL